MTIVVPNVGAGLAIGAFLNKHTPQNARLRLFKSNTTPAETDTAASFTESDFSGYANIVLTGANWTINDAADPASGSYAQQTFTLNADIATQNQYGYYCTQETSGILMFAERFSDGPYPLTSNGDNVKVTPVFTGD